MRYASVSKILLYPQRNNNFSNRAAPPKPPPPSAPPSTSPKQLPQDGEAEAAPDESKLTGEELEQFKADKAAGRYGKEFMFEEEKEQHAFEQEMSKMTTDVFLS